VVAALGKPVHPATASRALARLGLPRNKKSTHAAEQGRPDVKAARDVWFEQFAGVRADELVFVDESGATTAMQRAYGRAPPGERVVAAVPHGHWKVISTVAAMTTAGMVAAAGFDGATDTGLFAAFVRDGLVPVLRPGQVVVTDNLSPHKAAEARRLVESAGARLALLPPYSPDFNPIELAFSKVKTVLRSMARREVAALYDAIAEAPAAITPQDAVNYMLHRGYTLQ
jgi:transposase